MKHFRVLGPYDVPRIKGKQEIDFDRCNELFDKADEDGWKKYSIEEISSGIGCYVVGISPAGSSVIRPCYVGQTLEQSLRKRVFQKTDKEFKFNEALSEFKRARPLVYLLPLFTPNGRLAKPGAKTHKKVVNAAEFMLIGLALKANPKKLWNIKHSVFLNSFSIDGAFNTSRRITHAAESFGYMMQTVKVMKNTIKNTDYAPNTDNSTLGNAEEFVDVSKLQSPSAQSDKNDSGTPD